MLEEVNMKITFVQTQPWEKEIIRRKLRGQKLTFFDEALTEKNVAKIKDTEVLSVFIETKVTKKLLGKLPKLKMVVTRSTGYDHIDVKACTRRGCMVYNIPTYGENTVAEHAFALILALSRNVHKSYVRTLRNDFSIEGLKGFDLKDKVLGVVGAGNIGKHVIRMGRGFDMDVIVYDRHPDNFLAEEMNFKYVSFDTLLKKSDIVTLHIPYCKENHHLLDKKKLKMMKKGAILINTSRGGIVDTHALLDSLKSKHLAGAGLDVIEGEELIKEEKNLVPGGVKRETFKQILEDHMLMSMDNVVFTPHIAFYSQEALERILNTTIENIQNFVAKKDLDRNRVH